MEAEAFAAEAQSISYLDRAILVSNGTLFEEFHNHTLDRGQPMATVFVTDRSNCRKCEKSLILEKDSHPVVIYHASRGTYMGCRLSKICRKCRIYEHCVYWTYNGQKHFHANSLQLPFLLSTEDTAFDANLLKECSNLLIVGAVPFSTFSLTYNRRFGYSNHREETDVPRVKREKR